MVKPWLKHHFFWLPHRLRSRLRTAPLPGRWELSGGAEVSTALGAVRNAWGDGTWWGIFGMENTIEMVIQSYSKLSKVIKSYQKLWSYTTKWWHLTIFGCLMSWWKSPKFNEIAGYVEACSWLFLRAFRGKPNNWYFRDEIYWDMI